MIESDPEVKYRLLAYLKMKHVFYQESVAIVAVLNYKSNKYLRNESTTHN